MSSNTKIVVLRSKELVYALVLLVVSVLIIMVAVSLFMPSGADTPVQGAEENSSESPSEISSESLPGVSSGVSTGETDSTGAVFTTGTYVPGIYSSTLQLGSSMVELQIAVDKNHINSINLTNIDESITTLYPLMRPTLSELSAVILAEQSVENVRYSDENRYTSMLLMQAITTTLDKAAVSENEDRPETGVIY